jgi:predicted RNA binding protein YcfA (HicA-like mRNA interferase family)
VSSREVIRELLKNGWFEVAQIGSHKQFKHASKQGRVTVPHPREIYRLARSRALRSRRESSWRNAGNQWELDDGIHRVSA